MIDHILALREFEVKVRADGTISLYLAKVYVTSEWVLDLDQAEALSKSLAEMTAGLREHPWAAGDFARD